MFTTIHISANCIRLTTVNRNTIHKWAVSQLESGLVRDGKIINVKKVADVIDKLFQSVSAPKRNVIITMSGLPYTYRTIDFPRMKPEQVEDVMNYNLQSEFTVPLESLYLSWAPINEKHDSVEYFVIGADRQFVNTIIDVANIIEINDWSLDVRPLALARAAGQTNTVIVSLDRADMEMVLVQDGKIMDMHSVQIDTDTDSYNRDNYFNVFAGELSKLISYHYSKQNSDFQINAMPIIVTGEVIADSLETVGSEELLEELRDLTGYPVEYLETTIQYPQNFVPADYVTNVGLALRKSKRKSKSKDDYNDINLDLLRGGYDRKPQSLSFRYIVLPALLVLTIGIAMTLVNANAHVKAEIIEMEDDLAIATHNLIVARGAETEAADIQNRIDAATASLHVLQSERNQLLRDKGMYTSNLAAVTSSLPEGTTFGNMMIGNKTIRISGLAADSNSVIEFVRALEKAGFTDLNIDQIGNPNDEGQYPYTILINRTNENPGE